MNLTDDGLGKLTLLTLLNLTFVANPRVKDLLGLGGEGSALLELVGLSLKLGGFLVDTYDIRIALSPSVCLKTQSLLWKQQTAAW